MICEQNKIFEKLDNVDRLVSAKTKLSGGRKVLKPLNVSSQQFVRQKSVQLKEKHIETLRNDLDRKRSRLVELMDDLANKRSKVDDAVANMSYTQTHLEDAVKATKDWPPPGVSELIKAAP